MLGLHLFVCFVFFVVIFLGGGGGGVWFFVWFFLRLHFFSIKIQHDNMAILKF